MSRWKHVTSVLRGTIPKSQRVERKTKILNGFTHIYIKLLLTKVTETFSWQSCKHGRDHYLALHISLECFTEIFDEQLADMSWTDSGFYLKKTADVIMRIAGDQVSHDCISRKCRRNWRKIVGGCLVLTFDNLIELALQSSCCQNL